MAAGIGPSGTMKTRATYEDLLAVPDHKVAEILDGELFVSPRPAAPHARTASVLGVEIGSPFDRGRGGPGGWWILDEPELHLGGDVLVPDLAGWRRERMSPCPRGVLHPRAGLGLRGGVAFHRADRSAEAADLRARGRFAPLARDPGPDARGLPPAPDAWLLAPTPAGDEVVRAEPFDAVELTLTALWI